MYWDLTQAYIVVLCVFDRLMSVKLLIEGMDNDTEFCVITIVIAKELC
jgi:hypothetical protein